MNDSYQAIYDAVRSRISGGDIGQAVSEAVRQEVSGLSCAIESAKNEFLNTEFERQRPSVLYQPKLSIDGNQWCALYGDDLQSGVAGFGDSPASAMIDFDVNWARQLAP